MPGPGAEHNSPERRLDTVEQEAGFTGRAVERLDETMAELSSQLYELNARMDRLEKRLSDLAMGNEDTPNEPPPHSHRPL